MNTTNLRRWAVGLVALICATIASAQPATRVKVDWTDPAQFAETRNNLGFRQIEPKEWLDLLARHLQRGAERALPEGQHLEVTFTDIKRAGSFEPWRGPEWNDVRIVKDIYPPSIDLRFTLTDADGHALKQGERKLRDVGFLNQDLPNQSDTLRYEKRLLDEWMRKEFGAAKSPNG
jgi:hypothetical protein